MSRFLIDADLPRSVFAALRECGLLALVSADKGFTNLLRFPLGSHHGIVVARFPRHTPARIKTRLLVRWLPSLREEDLAGNLLIIQPKRIRIRRAKH